MKLLTQLSMNSKNNLEISFDKRVKAFEAYENKVKENKPKSESNKS